MLQFLQNTLKFFVFSLIISFLLVIIFFYTNNLSLKYIPAPNLSNSYSFNEKIRFLRTKDKEFDVISIGSSCTLNNLSSEVVVSKLNTNSFLNAASWGLNMKDIFKTLKIIDLEYDFKEIIIVSTFQDFQREEKKINESLVRYYLNSDQTELYTHIKSFNLKYYFTNFSYNKKVKNDSIGFNSLIYDKYGAVPLPIIPDKTNDPRWNLNFLDDKFKANQYNYLDSIASYCNLNRIKLYFFQSPIREGLHKKLRIEEMKSYKHHVEKVEQILNLAKHDFVNSDDIFWPDSLFNDGVHFNNIGAIQFTERCFNKLLN